MTDAEKREKVIRGMEAHANPKTCETCAGEDCPYYNKGGSYAEVTCSSFLAADALALLREQEPRVLTKSEAISYPEKQNAFSDSDKAPLYVEYKKPQPYFVKWVMADSVYLWMNDIELSLDYGKEYRFWTSRPTEEQRKEVPWDE